MKPKGWHPHIVPNNQKKKKNNHNNSSEAEARGRRTEEAGHKRKKKGAEENGVKHSAKVKDYQVNCLAQMVEDKERRGGSEGHPSSHLYNAHRAKG